MAFHSAAANSLVVDDEPIHRGLLFDLLVPLGFKVLEAQDAETCLEMLEHVPDPASVVAACKTLVKPGGLVFFSTINRNPKSYLFAIIGAEYVLNLLPRGTHDYARFIRPSELAAWSRDSGLKLLDQIGMGYNPLSKKYFLQQNLDVNYIACYQRPES